MHACSSRTGIALNAYFNNPSSTKTSASWALTTEFVLLYLAQMDSNDPFPPRRAGGALRPTGTTASRRPGVTARDIGARSSHREVKVGPLSPERAHPHLGLATCPASVPSPTRRVHVTLATTPQSHFWRQAFFERMGCSAFTLSRHGHCTVLLPCESPHLEAADAEQGARGGRGRAARRARAKGREYC